MKMLILVHNIAGHGGSFTRSRTLAGRLAATGHEVTLVAVSRDARYRPRVSVAPGLRIVETPMAAGGHYQSGGWGVLDILFRLGYAALTRFDLVYAFEHRPSVSVPAYYRKFVTRTPLIADWGDLWCTGGHLDGAKNFPCQYPIERVLEEHIKRASDGVTTVSRPLRRRACELGIPEERVLYLPSGADTEHIRPLPKTAMRELHAISLRDRVVGFISANVVEVEMLMRGMAMVFKERGDCRLLFIGTDTGWHRDLARQLRIDDRIIWTGFRPYRELPELLACCDILALPRSDAPINQYGVAAKMYDYMAAGKATVACEVGDMGRIIAEEGIGVLARPRADDFARMVLFLLDRSDLAEEMGARARRAAETTYSPEAMADRFIAFARRVTGLR